MNQLVVLQEIFESFSTGGDALSDIDPGSIEGSCSDLVGRLLERAKMGKIDEDVCSSLAEGPLDIYEIKRLGDICRRAGHYALAIKCYNKALSTTRDQNVRPVLLNNLGQVYSRQADPGRAAVYYQKAADGFELTGDKSGLAHILGNLGSSYRRSRDWDKAVEHCYKSLKTFEEIGDEFGAAQMTGSLGRIYAEMGERDLAIRYFEKSLKDFQRLGDKKSVARILDRMGGIHARSRSWEEAVRCYNKSIAVFNELGQQRSSGIVLSHLGRMYLEKGDAETAGDALDSSLRLMRKDMQPAYQNAVAAMAACCSLTAKSILEKGGDRALASQYFASASDRYQELSSFTKTDIPQIRIAASIARSCSYMARLQPAPSDNEAISLAERAISSLDSAIANSEGPERTRITALKRTLMGMKEIWSAGLLESEPWGMTKSLSRATEYMRGGACVDGEAGSCLCDALQALGAGLEAEMRREAPILQLKDAASHLRRAEERLKSQKANWGRESALQISQAAALIEGLICRETGQSAASQSSISDLLNYKAHRDALLCIAWVTAKEALCFADSTSRVFAWDEAFNLVDNVSITNSLAEPEIEGSAAEAEVEVEPARLQDAGLWLTPVKSGLAKSSAAPQMLVASGMYAARAPVFERIEIPEPSTAVRTKAVDNAAEPANILGFGSADRMNVSGFGKSDGQKVDALKGAGRISTGGSTENAENAKNAENELEAWREWISAAVQGVISAENAVKVIRALVIAVVVLMAIRVILYLI